MGFQIVSGVILVIVFTIVQCLDWKFHASQPDVPTIAEHGNFIDDTLNYVLKAERNRGGPGSSVVAKAIQDSCYGYTRTALNANDLFAFKWVSTASAENRTFWKLAGQPAFDPNKGDTRFRDQRDSVYHITGQVAKTKYYCADTLAFKAAIARGDGRTTSISGGIDGISDPYNFAPALYIRTVKHQPNNSIAPLNKLSRVDSLYRLVPTGAAAEARLPNPVAITDYLSKLRKLYQRGIDAGGRYMQEGGVCKDGAESDPDYADVIAPYRTLPAKGVPVIDCTYPFVGKKARVLMANVEATQLARWTLSACTANPGGNLERCLAVTSHNLWCGSNAQFVISGAVREPAATCGGPAGREALITFRDGVTVKTKDAPYCALTPFTKQEEDASLTGPVLLVKKFGRISMATRAIYRDAHGNVNVSASKPDSSGNNAWLSVVRESYVEAVGQESYSLLTAWARSRKGEFSRYGALGIDRFDCKAYYDVE